MPITKAEVEHVAWLSRLVLTEKAKEKLMRQLSQILDHAGKISELDTTEVQPTSHPLPVKNVFREDKKRPSLSQEQALFNAPKKEKDGFVVPKII